MEKDKLKIINNLIVKIGKGDEQSLRELYQILGNRIFSVAIGVTKDRQLAEDAVQECMIKVVKYAASFEKHENGYGWICTIVRNESLSILKKYKPPDANIDDFFNLSDYTFNDRAQKKLEVETAIKQLSKDDQYLIWLRYMCDMTVREIAAHLNKPKSSIMYQLQKAEKLLRKLLL